jgi:DME family drug/metabolite transporter
LTVATLVEPLTAVALSALLLGEHLSAMQWLGGALLMGSIWGLSVRDSRTAGLERPSKANLGGS